MRGHVPAALATLAALAIGAGCTAEVASPPAETEVSRQAVAALSSAKTDWLFDDHAAPRLVRLEVAPVDWQWLQDHATEEQYVPAAVVFEGERFEGAAVRYKGGFGSLYACFDAQGNRTCPKLSLKVSFNEYDSSGRFYGVRKLVLNSCNRDPTCLHERLSYALFRDAGVEASRAVHAVVSVNDGPPSYYVLVEHIDKEWIQDRYADDEGNLYKETWPQHTTPEPYIGALRTNESAPDVWRMVALGKLLAGVGPEEPVAPLVEPWLDLDALARYVAVDLLTVNWDGITAWYCQGDQCGNHNLYWYDDPTSGRLVLIPWDLDHTFNRPDRDLGRAWHDDGPDACVVSQANAFVGTRAPQCDPLMRALLVEREDAWRAALAELTAPGTGPLAEAAVLQRLDRYRAMLLPWIDQDPLGPDGLTWRRETARMRQIIREQLREIAQRLAEP